MVYLLSFYLFELPNWRPSGSRKFANGELKDFKSEDSGGSGARVRLLRAFIMLIWFDWPMEPQTWLLVFYFN